MLLNKSMLLFILVCVGLPNQCPVSITSYLSIKTIKYNKSKRSHEAIVQMTPFFFFFLNLFILFLQSPHRTRSARHTGTAGSVTAHAACLSLRDSRERAPPGRGRWASVWRGGLGSATSRGIDRIKLDLSEINTKERRATRTHRRGRRRETRRRNISRIRNLNFFLLLPPVYLYFKRGEKKKRTTADFFSSSNKRRY